MTLSVCCCDRHQGRGRDWVCLLLMMAAANNAALIAPALPIASVPTGIPAGICTMDNKESIPFRALDGTGTPKPAGGLRRCHAGQVGRTSGTGNNDFQTLDSAVSA